MHSYVRFQKNKKERVCTYMLAVVALNKSMNITIMQENRRGRN